MRRVCLVLFLSISVLLAWQEKPGSSKTPLAERVVRRMADNIKRLPDYTCRESIERSVRNSGKDKYRDRVHIEVAFIQAGELFAWPGSDRFEAGLIHQLAQGTGAIGSGGFGGWTGSLFGASHPYFQPAGACAVEGRPGTRFDFYVPASASTHKIVLDGRSTTPAYGGFICVDPDSADVLMLEVHDRAILLPIAECSETIHYGRTRVGEGEFLLPQSDELVATDLAGNQSRNLTRFASCRQYTSYSSIAFDTEGEGAAVPGEASHTTKPAKRELVLPPGLTLDLSLETPIRWESSAIGDPVQARLKHAIHAGDVAIPSGATVSGRIHDLGLYHQLDAFFAVSLELDTAAFASGRARFKARLVGPSLDTWSGDDAFYHGVQNLKRSTGLDMATAPTPFGAFRVAGDRLHIDRGLHMIYRTEPFENAPQ